MTDKYGFNNCGREEGDCIEGDQLLVVCRTPKPWKLDRITESHRGKRCIVQKNAKARVLRSYTNIR